MSALCRDDGGNAHISSTSSNTLSGNCECIACVRASSSEWLTQLTRQFRRNEWMNNIWMDEQNT